MFQVPKLVERSTRVEYFLHGVRLRQRAGEFKTVGRVVLFAERLFAGEEYDRTGSYAGRAVRIALVGGTKGAGETFWGQRRVNGVRKRTLR